MFCYQCEQTAQGKGCTKSGVCGKEPLPAALQDLLVTAVQGMAQYAHRLQGFGIVDREANVQIVETLFATVTNVNFDPTRLLMVFRAGLKTIERLKAKYEDACRKAGKTVEAIACSVPGLNATDSAEDLAKRAEGIQIDRRVGRVGPDVIGLQELVMYGLKGAAAYLDHAQVLGVVDDATFAAFNEIVSFVANNPTNIPQLTAMALKTGEVNLKAMELLDTANTTAYGHPEPTPVRITPVKGKGILVSGHDLKDLEDLLKQTEGKGVNVYTHGEMLPAHAYPGLKKYKHLVGNYGGAWQDQAKEFDEFPGAVLMTTNCIQKPRDSYKARIFTSGVVAWPGVTHIAKRDFAPVIKAALAAPGFSADGENKTIMTGFARNAVMSVAGAVIDAVKAGKIRHFFLIGGCDGAKPGRNYYTDLAQAVPKDCVILTLACGKYRFNKLPFGDIGGIPRLLDVGQCNDAYSAVQIAVALSKAFGVGVNELPLSLVLSWYEQKAVAILLSLLHLGIKNIRVGPSLPAFVTPPVLKVLVENFNIAPVTTPQEDLKAILKN
ncbi:MAG: hydroxylamine reductase [Planctomycetota bacterium]|nr:hydroxylamine reductase [Planctomycetota bacterium]